MGKRPDDLINDRNSSRSFSSNGEYSHPLGFREKSWMLSQPLTLALSTTFENPSAMEI
jgi:hypothetical protein